MAALTPAGVAFIAFYANGVGMAAHQQPAPLIVVRSEAAPGRVGLRLIGELDLNTVELLEAELARTREHSAPSVIDLSELRFLDLAGLRALQLAVQHNGADPAQLIGAKGIVRRLLELADTLDAGGDDAARAPVPAEPTTTFGARNGSDVANGPDRSATNGARAGTPNATNGDAP